MHVPPRLAPLLAPLPLESRDKHARRIRALLLFGGSVTLLNGGGWALYYALETQWLPMAVSAVLAMCGALCTAWAWAHRARAAALLCLPLLMVVTGVFCFFGDIPTDGVPRSVHLYFVALAACALLVYRREALVLRVGFPVLCFLACAVLGCTSIGAVDSPFHIPPQARLIGVWINHGIALSTLGAAIWIMQADLSVRHAIEADLRRALADSQFRLHYQPQVREDGTVLGAEALLRWQHPERGTVLPGSFISVAEETGLIVPIGEWVLRMACAQLAQWAGDPRTAALTLSVNVSASQFRQPDFLPQVLSIVGLSGIKPSRLKLELTESMMVKDIEEVVHKMQALRAHGIGLSLDDFGTGFSSLSYLKSLPIEQLKIDRSFVKDLLADANSASIVQTLLSLGKGMRLNVIAEGVETEEQRGWLRRHGCEVYQGYLFSKPLPLEQFTAFVAASAACAEACGVPC